MIECIGEHWICSGIFGWSNLVGIFAVDFGSIDATELDLNSSDFFFISKVVWTQSENGKLESATQKNEVKIHWGHWFWVWRWIQVHMNKRHSVFDLNVCSQIVAIFFIYFNAWFKGKVIELNRIKPNFFLRKLWKRIKETLP